jgi:ABC-type nitrate/sulfonate/bicarbonate transport system substrate-binding protein
MKKNMLYLISFLILFVFLGFVAWYSLQPPASPEPPDSIVVAWSPFEHSTLLFIAEDQHYFEKNGLNVTLRRYDTGAASLDAVVNGEADITVGVTEFPLVRMVLLNSNISAVASIDKGDIIYIVAGKDRGILNVSDLKGKRVGTTIGTVAEFHLGRFLALHGITRQDITLVDLKTPEEWVNAVADGKVDAISTAQPYANAARDRLGDNAVVWPAQSNQPIFALVVSMEDWITMHPELVTKILKSLEGAEGYANSHPSESRAIVRKKLNLDTGYIDTVWQRNQFSLTLDQSLIIAMEDEARWMIENNLTNETSVPNFLTHIYTDGLERVKPGSVYLIG